MGSHDTTDIIMKPTHRCDQRHRLDALERNDEDKEERIRMAEKQLAEGNTTFAEIRKDIQALTATLQGFTNAAWWIVGLLVVGVLSAAGSALVWAIQQMPVAK